MPKAPPEQPPYPVIHPDPTVQTCLKALRFTDYLTIGGATSASWAYGFIFGKPVRGPTAATAATIGFAFGALFTAQTSLARFLGYRENAKEVKKYGLYEMQPGPGDYEGKPLGSHYYNQPINWTKQ